MLDEQLGTARILKAFTKRKIDSTYSLFPIYFPLFLPFVSRVSIDFIHETWHLDVCHLGVVLQDSTELDSKVHEDCYVTEQGFSASWRVGVIGIKKYKKTHGSFKGYFVIVSVPCKMKGFWHSSWGLPPIFYSLEWFSRRNIQLGNDPLNMWLE